MSEVKVKPTVGRRKTAIARVELTSGSGKIVINGRDVNEYFSVPRMRQAALQGLEMVGGLDKYDARVLVKGGGPSGQAGAVRLGIARALEKLAPSVRPELKKAGLFRRDPRMVERKKYGLHKARRGTQFSKR